VQKQRKWQTASQPEGGKSSRKQGEIA